MGLSSRSLHRLFVIPSALVLGLCAPAALRAQSPVAGDWQGTLAVNGTTLHLALHISGSGDTLQATLDSIDQNAFGLPVSSISFHARTLTLAAETLHAGYTATLSADGGALSGTFTQGGASLPVNFARLSAPQPAKPAADKAPKPGRADNTDEPGDSVEGTWSGAFSLPSGKLPVVFHFVSAAGKLSATMDSPRQGATGIAVTLTRAGNSLHMAVSFADATFDGSFSPDLQTLTGTWTQRGNSLPLVLTRSPAGNAASASPTAQVAAPRRPQNPVPPFPYRAEDVSYTNTQQGDTLAATLTIPPGKGPFPAVLLITGSGAQDRDETLLGHKPFLVLADFLSRHGIAVLRADDRGTARSTGNFATATTEDFATDTEAGVAFLRTRREINPRRIGLIGHSEGGLVASLVASHNPGIAFIVLLSAPGVPGDQIVTEQQRQILLASGLPQAQLDESVAVEKQLLAADEQPGTAAEREQRLRTLLLASQPGATPEQLGPLVDQLTSPWFRGFLMLDPAAFLRKVKCPVLVLSGSKDLQVPPAQNLPAIRAALTAAGNSRVEVHEVPGLNHLFQPSSTGLPSEYAAIETTIDPAVLEIIARWVLQQHA